MCGQFDTEGWLSSEEMLLGAEENFMCEVVIVNFRKWIETNEPAPNE